MENDDVVAELEEVLGICDELQLFSYKDFLFQSLYIAKNGVLDEAQVIEIKTLIESIYFEISLLDPLTLL